MCYLWVGCYQFSTFKLQLWLFSSSGCLSDGHGSQPHTRSKAQNPRYLTHILIYPNSKGTSPIPWEPNTKPCVSPPNLSSSPYPQFLPIIPRVPSQTSELLAAAQRAPSWQEHCRSPPGCHGNGVAPLAPRGRPLSCQLAVQRASGWLERCRGLSAHQQRCGDPSGQQELSSGQQSCGGSSLTFSILVCVP